MGDDVLDAKAVSALATLPSLDQLRGKILGLLQAPATQHRRRAAGARRPTRPRHRRLRRQRRRLSHSHPSTPPTDKDPQPMAKLEKLVEDLSALTVLEAAELSKLLEEKWGVSAAAPVAVAAAPAAGGAAGGAAAGRSAEEQTEFTVMLTAGGDKQINVIKEVRARPRRPRPEGSQGPGRRRAAEREGERLQAGSGRDQEEARSRRRDRRDQVAKPATTASRRGAPFGLASGAKWALHGQGLKKSRGRLFSYPRRATKYAFLSNQRHDSHARARIAGRAMHSPRGAVRRPPTSAKGRPERFARSGISSVRQTACRVISKPPV